MTKLYRTSSDDPNFRVLEKKLDAYLAIVDGDDHAFYDQYNHVSSIKNVVIAFVDEKPVSCGAFKEYESKMVEVKRMFTLPEFRGKGLASAVLSELEMWAAEVGFNSCILETGKKQTEAVAMYSRRGYHVIPNFGPYDGVEGSVCFEKKL
jgi:putative acetyltransferase